MDNFDESVVDFAIYIMNQYIRGRPAHDIGDNNSCPSEIPPRNVECIYELVLSRRQIINNVVESLI